MDVAQYLATVDIANYESAEHFWAQLHGLSNKDVVVIARSIFEERQSGRVNTQHSAFFFESIDNTQIFHTVVSPYLSVLLEKLNAIQFPPGDILELGCGAGVAACYLAAKFPEKKVVGVDLFPAVVETAENIARLLKLTNVEFRQAQIAELDLNRTFGSVLSVALREEMSSGRQGSFGYFSAIQEMPEALRAPASHLSRSAARHLSPEGMYFSFERCHDIASLATWIGELHSAGLAPRLELSEMLAFSSVLTGVEKMPFLVSQHSEEVLDARALLGWRSAGSEDAQSKELNIEKRVYENHAWKIVKATEFGIRDELGDAAARVYLLECDREGLVYFTTNRGAREIIFETSFGGAQILTNKFEHLLGELTYNPSVVDVRSITSL